MSNHRKLWIGFGAFCLLTCMAAILRGTWLVTHDRAPDGIVMLVAGLLTFWVGHAVACALKDNPNL
jgi:hypothetical protein